MQGPAKKLTEADLERAIAKAHDAPAWACLFQVKNQTGYQLQVERFADAIAMSLWPSRGLHIHGFEIKIDRGDWLRELKDPEKAEEIARYCHYWWVVTPRENVIVKGEMPDGWGWKVLEGSRLVTKKEAPIRTPEAVSPHFLAALLRRATEGMVPRSQIHQALDEARKELEQQIEKRMARDAETKVKSYDRVKGEYDLLLQRVQDFEKASGVELGHGYWFDGKRIGEAVRAVLDHREDKNRAELERMAHMAEAIALRVRGYLKATSPEVAS